MLKSTLICLILGSAALADGCPVAPNYEREMDSLFAQMQNAQSEGEVRVLSAEMWRYLLRAPDEPSQSMLDEAMAARLRFDYVLAIDRLNALVSYCPFYAEGYNQRAFVNFLREDYARAVPDLEYVLQINPRHIGALTGLAFTFLALDREDEAQALLLRAVALNPWLAERALLKPDDAQEL